MKNRIITVSLAAMALSLMLATTVSQAQIGIKWSQVSSAFAYLGSAEMDGDGHEELVYYDPAPDRIFIFDGVTGSLDWDSGIWEYIGIAGYIGSDSVLRGFTPFCDINNDGIKEITFRGQQYLSSPIEVYVVGMGGSGVTPGGNPATPGIQILSQNYPNPFNPTTNIQYTLTAPGRAVIKIYNAQGQEVRTLVDETKQPGDYTVSWSGDDQNGQPVASGAYFYQLQVGDYTSARKAILMK